MVQKARKKQTKHRALIALRTFHGYTQKDMAAAIGISESAYQSKEVGRHKFSATEATKICKVLNVRFEDIFLPKNYEQIVEGIKISVIPESKGKGFEVELPEEV